MAELKVELTQSVSSTRLPLASSVSEQDMSNRDSEAPGVLKTEQPALLATKSSLECILLLFGSGIGTGVMVLPHTAAAIGWMPMIILFFVGGAISASTTWMLFMLTDRILTEKRASGSPKPDITYGEVLEISTGKPWASTVLDLMLVTYCTGTVTARVVFLSDFLKAIPIWQVDQTTMKILVSLLQAPFMLADTVGGLTRWAGFTIYALMALTVVILFQTPGYMAVRTEPLAAVGDLSQLPGGLCVCLFAFNWHNNGVGIARELARPTPAKSVGISVAACVVLGLLYAITAFGGYMSFGPAVDANVVNMYPVNDALFIVVRLALSGSVLITCPVSLIPTRESFIKLVRKRSPTFAERRIVRQILGMVLVVNCLAISIAVPDILTIIRWCGGCLTAFLMVGFPVVSWGLLLHRERFWIIAMLQVPFTMFLILAATGVI